MVENKTEKVEEEPRKLKVRLGEGSPASAESLAMRSGVQCHDSSSEKVGKYAHWVPRLSQKGTASVKVKKFCQGMEHAPHSLLQSSTLFPVPPTGTD